MPVLGRLPAQGQEGGGLRAASWAGGSGSFPHSSEVCVDGATCPAGADPDSERGRQGVGSGALRSPCD